MISVTGLGGGATLLYYVSQTPVEDVGGIGSNYTLSIDNLVPKCTINDFVAPNNISGKGVFNDIFIQFSTTLNTYIGQIESVRSATNTLYVVVKMLAGSESGGGSSEKVNVTGVSGTFDDATYTKLSNDINTVIDKDGIILRQVRRPSREWDTLMYNCIYPSDYMMSYTTLNITPSTKDWSAVSGIIKAGAQGKYMHATTGQVFDYKSPSTITVYSISDRDYAYSDVSGITLYGSKGPWPVTGSLAHGSAAYYEDGAIYDGAGNGYTFKNSFSGHESVFKDEVYS